MRTAAWSLALVAGALADDTWSWAASAPTNAWNSNPWVAPLAKNPSSFSSVANSGAQTTVTSTTRIYTTVCPSTSVFTSAGCTISKPYAPSGAASVPWSGGQPSGAHSGVWSGQPSGAPSGVWSSESGVAHSGTWSASASAVVPFPSGSETAPISIGLPTSYAAVSTSSSSMSSSSSHSEVSPVSTAPVSTESIVYVTDETTVYTTFCPVTATQTSGQSTWTSVFTTLSTVTSVHPTTRTTTRTHSGSAVTTGPVSGATSLTTISDFTTFTSLCTETANGTTVVETHTHSKPITTTSTVTGHGQPTGSISGFPSGSMTAPLNFTSSLPTGTSMPSSSTVLNATSISSHAPSSTACVPCEGQPGNNPEEWCGYTITDNWYEVVPKTCHTVTYEFDITQVNVSPDGVERMAMVINGQMPGPLIEANWGDNIVVKVTNSLPLNGTSIHFHGMRQNYTNEMDGVAAITQCALAPGESMTYNFTATNYGTSWYHSHFAIQAYEGVFGPMIIHGPNSGGAYDAEQMVVLQDWSHQTADEKYFIAQVQGGPPTLDNGLINGQGIWENTGSRFEMNVVAGQTYRLRVVNAAIQSTFKFYIDGHSFKVIAMDYVPIEPYETTILNINIGQRYDLLVTFDQPVADYWMRSDAQQACSSMLEPTNIKGIVHYAGSPSSTPTSTAYTYTDECVDEPYASLVPVVPISAGGFSQEITEVVSISQDGGSPNLFKWTLSGATFQSQWGDATLSSIYGNGTVPTYSGRLAIEVPNLKEWVYVIIDSPIPSPHPIHLHGHDFLILAQGAGLYTSAVELNLVNPPRRDVALMPYTAATGGYLVLAFETDNPGAWLMHCHIGWHVSMGFALQIIENLEGIKDTVTAGDALEETCASWNAYANPLAITAQPYDSGV